MNAFCVQVQLPDGTASYMTSMRAADELVQKGRATKLRRKAHQRFVTIRMRPEAIPSKSADSICVLTSADTETLVGCREISASELQWLRRKLDHFKPSPLPVVYA